MSDYRSVYCALAARVTDAIELLIKVQQEGEDGAIEEGIILEIAPGEETKHPNDAKTVEPHQEVPLSLP